MDAKRFSDWVRLVARVGHTAKGAVYVLVGLFSLLAAIGGDWTQEPQGSSGALSSAAAQPFGRILMVSIGSGLLCYAFWCGFEALQGYWESREHKNKGLARILHQGKSLFEAGFYGYLGLGAFELGVDTDNDDALEGGDDSEIQEGAVGFVLSHAFGRELVYGLGICIAGAGLYQAYRGLIASFRDDLCFRDATMLERWGATWIGRLGTIARGLVFVRVGSLVFIAARTLNPERVATPGEALKELENQINPWLFGMLSLGLIAYGLHMLVLARYQQFDSES